MLLDIEKKTSLELSCKIILDRVRHHMESDVSHKFNGHCYIVTSEHFSSKINIKDHYKVYYVDAITQKTLM